jgi:acetyl-CoA decarbonylase/synthase complex subunit beta
MNPQAVKEILGLLPKKVGRFNNTEFPLPIRATFLSNGPLSLSRLKKSLVEKQEGDVKDLLQPILLAGETIEAASPDRDDFFITDRKMQKLVFTGSKWRAGWVLVLGNKDQKTIVKRLKDLNFMVFTDQPDIEDTIYIGGRPTSPVYFLQLMVRYGLVWGRIAPGDDHEMGHFLETDMPGFILITEDLPCLKYVITLGLMKLGAPAIVPSSFPFPYGNRIVADTVDEAVERGAQFPNLRKKFYKEETIELPHYCNPAYAKEEFPAKQVFGNSEDSFFCLRPGPGSGRPLTIIGSPENRMGILIEVDEGRLTVDVAGVIERVALKSINTLPGYSAQCNEGIFSLSLKQGVVLEEEKIRDAVYWGIRLKYPRIKNIYMILFYEKGRLKEAAEKAAAYHKNQKETVEGMNEDNTEDFCFCIECRPFSLEHTCIIVPNRLPMCASRTYGSAKAASLFGSDVTPYQRRREKDLALRNVFDKGEVIDADKGEYEGCNQIYKELTGGKLKRVQLHSIREFPQTSCGCFQTLVFWIKEIDGIGIMKRGSETVTPDGRNWAVLANLAGGKQSPGIMGVSINYIRSPYFLKGDGGIGKVVWMDSELYKKLEDILLPDQKVATEKDVSSIEALKAFINESSA